MKKFKAVFVPKGSRYGYSLIIEAHTKSEAEKEDISKSARMPCRISKGGRINETTNPQ